MVVSEAFDDEAGGRGVEVEAVEHAALGVPEELGGVHAREPALALERLTIQPSPAARMSGSTDRARSSGACTLASNVSRRRFSGKSASGLGREALGDACPDPPAGSGDQGATSGESLRHRSIP
ncbi:MAG: hypothetical protein ACRDQB_17765 [Thermocrispum sp.]